MSRLAVLRGVRAWLAGIVLLLILSAIAVLVLDLQRQTSRLAASAADNMQWTLGQAEVELMALEIAALRAARGEKGLEEVRLRYDVFYSRIGTLVESDRFESLLQIGVMPDRLKEILDFRERWLPVIDGPDDALRDALPDLADSADVTRESVRHATLTGVEYFSQLGYEQRESLSSSMARLGLLIVALVTMLAVTALYAFWLARKSDAEATANRETRERIETILSNSLDAVIVSDAEGRIIDYNGAAERIFGYSREEAIGAEMADLIVPDHYRSAHLAGMRRFHERGTHRLMGKGIVRLDARRQDGRVFPVDVSLAAAQSPSGEIFIAFLRDISDRVRSEAALKRARDRAIAGEKQKAELLAVMSHEMRTPLNGMIGTLELFDSEHLDARQQRYLRIIRDSGRILLGHVNDVLDISRLDAGMMSLRKVGFDLVALMEEIIDNQGERARARGNRLELAPPNPALHQVCSDPDRLRQILLNLVSNAIKFTWNGRITIEADCSNGLEAVEIRVTDTGIGIAEADLDRIFDDFVTIDSSYGRGTSGTGLGLGISQRLAVALGGELGAESEPGDGSVFWLRLPMAPPAHRTAAPRAADPAGPAPVLRPLDILMVEDNEVNRVVAQELLEREGHRVEPARDGDAALACAAARRFDVVLLDISMPGMDGLEVAGRMRASDGPNARTPIIATTAHALPREVQAFHAAGMQTVLIKPLTQETIRRALAEALEGTGPARQPIALASPPPGPAGLPEVLIDEGHLGDMRRELAPARMRHVHETFLREMTDFQHAMPDLLHEGGGALGTLAAEAHRMAGSAAVLGAQRLTGLLRFINTEANAGRTEALERDLDTLAECWGATRDALGALLDEPRLTG